MEDHLEMCENIQRRPPQQHNRHQPHPFMALGEEEEGYNPFGNFAQLFGMRPQQRNRGQEERRSSGPGMIIIESSDGQGNFVRRMVPADSFSGGSRRQHSPLTNFFALLERLAGRNADRDQGLNK